MFKIGLRPRALWTQSEALHVQRVLNLYVRRYRDDLLGLGYHQFIREGRGILVLQCCYRDLFFRKGFAPIRRYINAQNLGQEGLSHLQTEMLHYDPSTEIMVSLQVQNTTLEHACRVSKRGLSLAVLHRQYLNRLLDYAAVPGRVQHKGA